MVSKRSLTRAAHAPFESPSAGCTFTVEIDRRARFIASLHRGRIAGIRVPIKASVLPMRVSGLPEGVTLEPGRIEVRFDGAREAVQRLFALAQALTNDYATFETVVSDEERSR